jgi:hypothetical protein
MNVINDIHDYKGKNMKSPTEFNQPSRLKQLKTSLSRAFDIRFRQQNWFMDKMRLLRQPDEVRYASIKEGYCKGYSYMSMLSILGSTRSEQGELSGVVRLERMSEQLLLQSPQEFSERLHHLEQKRLQLFKEVKVQIDTMDEHQVTAELEQLQVETAATYPQKKQRLTQHIFEQQQKQTFPESELIELEVPSFFDGIELFQNTRAHDELKREDYPWIWRSQPIETMFPFLMPKPLEDVGGIVVVSEKSGVFLKKNAVNEDELELYFEILREQFKGLDFPITLQLGANAHMMSVHYDSVQDTWIFIDANQKPMSKNAVVKTSSSAELAQRIRTGFFTQKLPHVIMTTTLCVAKNHEASLKQAVTQLQHNPTFQALFEITPKKMQARSLTNNTTWLYEAMLARELETVQSMHQAGYVEYDEKLDLDFIAIQIKETSYAATYFQQEEAKSEDEVYGYGHRKELIAAARELKKTLDTTYTPAELHKSNQAKFQFLVDTIRNAPINDNPEKDKSDLFFSAVLCYIRWHYQGRDIDGLTAKDTTKYRNANEAFAAHFSPIRELDALLKRPMFHRIDDIVKHDKVIGDELRHLMQALETLHADESVLNFFADVLQQAGCLVIDSITQDEVIGVISEAFKTIYEQAEPSLRAQIDYVIWSNELTPELQKSLKENGPTKALSSDMRNQLATMRVDTQKPVEEEDKTPRDGKTKR